MARVTKEAVFTVADRDIKVITTQIDSLEALDLFSTLMDVFAPAAGTIITGLARGAEESVEGLVRELGGDEVSDAVRGTITRLPRAQRDAVILKILQGTRCVVDEVVMAPTSKDAIGAIFEADLFGMFRVLGFALTVQYGNFFGAIFNAYKALVAEAAAKEAAAKAAAKVAEQSAST